MNWWGIGFVSFLFVFIFGTLALGAWFEAEDKRNIPPRLPANPQRWRVLESKDPDLFDWQQLEEYRQN